MSLAVIHKRSRWANGVFSACSYVTVLTVVDYFFRSANPRAGSTLTALDPRPFAPLSALGRGLTVPTATRRGRGAARRPHVRVDVCKKAVRVEGIYHTPPDTARSHARRRRRATYTRSDRDRRAPVSLAGRAPPRDGSPRWGMRWGVLGGGAPDPAARRGLGRALARVFLHLSRLLGRTDCRSLVRVVHVRRVVRIA